ncbi:MAG: hypothetical protein KAV82_13725 [Phycisphaerae bacterium]|nr:hypothetical protein [Phycisphaerae bacterium]
MDNPLNWSFGIGRLFQIDLRVHVLFVLGALVVLGRSFGEEGGGLSDGAAQLAILFLIVLLHEFGHCFGCRATGGEAIEILMWPLGGLASVAPPHRWRAHLVTALAGPAVNVLFCLLTAAVLIVWTGSLAAVPWNPFHVFRPLDFAVFEAWAVQRWLVLFFGLNFMLLLFNLLPVYPLDGGQALQSILWPRMGYGRSMILASGIGMVGAIVIGLVGFFTETPLLYFIAIFGYLTCWQQRRQLRMAGEMETGPFGYDFSRGYSSLENGGESASEAHPGFFARRRMKREARRQENLQREAQERIERLDHTLAKVRAQGLGSLTRAERRFLEEESGRRQASEHH